ncbi:MAG: HAD-IIA family hydrolase [Candidatus Bipolaricaulis sp.]|nr:HAD-IIA family hydrolase [Candidatus Bipolaricaulis sp.]
MVIVKGNLSYEAFLVDVDGVLTRGSQPLAGAVEGLKALQARGRVVLLTNNSTRSRGQLSTHLTALGFPVSAADVFATSYLAARYLRDVCGSARVWVLGEDGLRTELAEAGHRLAERPTDADWVVVGMDRGFDYARLSLTLQALLSGARLLVTNEDATFPTTEGLVPGAGAIAGALRGMGYSPNAVIGKPSALAFAIALQELGTPKERVLVIGDRLETDIAGGCAAGMDTVLVLSGVSRESDLADSSVRPTWVAADLGSVAVEAWRRVASAECAPRSESR